MTTELPDRFDLATEPPADERLAALRELFPDVMREDKIDLDALRRSLGDWVETGQERFGLTWPGKAECMRVIQEPSIGTLVPMVDESVDWDATENVIVEGDNLEALKLLQKAYYGRVKLIYIDPPYNTGNDFIYPDNFKEGLAGYLRFSGQVDEAGQRLTANTETDGRYHSKWLSMIYPRLFLARNLLSDDGAIFVSIDDHEVHNLRAVMNEIFGEENFVATIVWQKVYARDNRKTISTSQDYIHIYAKNALAWKEVRNLIPRDEKQLSDYKNPDNDPRGPWKAGNFTAQAGHATPAQFYDITLPSGTVVSPPTGACWRYSEHRYQELLADNRIWFGSNGDGRPAHKMFLSEVQDGVVPTTWWTYEEVGHTQEAKKQLLELVEFESSETVFDTPKPYRLIERMLQIGTQPDSGDIVLDFFAGSGTTGEAVVRTNMVDGGNRRYILVQLPEPSGDALIPTLAELTRVRLRKAASKLQEEKTLLDQPADFGFRSYRLDSSNFTVWDGTTSDSLAIEQQLDLSVEHVRDNATELSMVTELLLKAGYSLTAPLGVVDFAGVPGYSIADGALLVCLSKELSIEAFEVMAEREPAMILVLDAGFGGSDELKVNALQTVRARNQQTGSDIALRVV